MEGFERPKRLCDGVAPSARFEMSGEGMKLWGEKPKDF